MRIWLAKLLRKLANVLKAEPMVEKRAHPIIGKEPATLAPLSETSSGLAMIPVGEVMVWLPGEWGTGPRSDDPYSFRVRTSGPYL